MDFVLLSLFLGGLVIAYYFYLTRNYSYWHNQGIPCAKGLLPGLGHMWPVMFLKMSLADFGRQIYERHPEHSMVGFYDKTDPALVIRDPELVKTVMQSNFASFSDNLLKVDPDLDPLFVVNPFFASGEMWLMFRKRLTHAFTGKRIRMLYSCVEQVCRKFDDYLERKFELSANNGVMELEMRDLFSKYTGEVVANASLGIEGFCFDDERHSASFVMMGKLVFDPTPLGKIVQTLNFFLPELNNILRMPFVPKHVDHFFRSTVKEVLRIRRQKIEHRNDFLQLMVDLEKTEGEQIDEGLLTAHAFSFFADGYDTSSVTLSFVAYQLAQHPLIQQRLRDEVETVLARYDGQLTYESLKELTYMDQVISESQRHYTSGGAMGKVCTEEFELKGSDGLRCRVKPGTKIIISVFGLHKDPKYWPDADVYDPERFAANRRAEIKKFTFLPFGEGPRACVGMRMALLQVKACLATFIRKYTLKISPKTQEPLRMQPGSFLTAPIGGIWTYVTRV
ncbi:PREDICTED: cytochrome P450 6a2-like [Dinoponera quadriceps]|uniref:Cytochrome P450 6a2-like n=1 Tax=Dinoponera quadriceps TaxID=609295 RepID=A0A6P3XD83_DINQU|nr:PREDICTED: cytochrome P450 6a2-like [Dinoponera quadriceps]